MVADILLTHTDTEEDTEEDKRREENVSKFLFNSYLFVYLSSFRMVWKVFAGAWGNRFTPTTEIPDKWQQQ